MVLESTIYTDDTENNAALDGSGGASRPHSSKGVLRAAIVLALALLSLAAAAVVGGILLLSSHTQGRLAPAAFVTSAFFFAASAVIPLGMVREGVLESEERRNYHNDYEAFKKPLNGIEQPTISGLALANFKQMRVFSIIAQRQARMAFYASLLGAGMSLFVLVAGATVAIGSTATASKVAAASLTVVGTALSSFLAKTFLKTYEMTSRQMSYYYGQPLVHCYLLHAEWLTLMSGDHVDKDVESKLWKEVIEASIQASVNAQNHLLSMHGPSPSKRTAGKARHQNVLSARASRRTAISTDAAPSPGQAAPASE
jgi:hypothetical protein